MGKSQKIPEEHVFYGGYPLVNIQKAIENCHFEWENPLFLWSCSIAMLNYQRVTGDRFILGILGHLQKTNPQLSMKGNLQLEIKL